MAREDGGSAFPQIETDAAESGIGGQPYSHTYSYGGMTLRDYFAAQALAAVIAFEDRGLTQEDALPTDIVARQAYAVADAMLKAREK